MIFVAEIFNMPNGISYLAGIKRSSFNFSFPAFFDLYVDGSFCKHIKVEGVILNNNYVVDEYFDKITVWTNGHLDKNLVKDKVDAYLRISFS